MGPHNHEQRSVRGNNLRESRSCGRDQRFPIDNRAELFRPFIAEQAPGERAQADAISSRKHNRPRLAAHDLAPSAAIAAGLFVVPGVVMYVPFRVEIDSKSNVVQAIDRGPYSRSCIFGMAGTLPHTARPGSARLRAR